MNFTNFYVLVHKLCFFIWLGVSRKDSFSTLSYTQYTKFQNRVQTVRGFFEQNLAKTISVYVHKSNDLRRLPKVIFLIFFYCQSHCQLEYFTQIFFLTPKVKYSGLFSWVMSEISYIFVGVYANLATELGVTQWGCLPPLGSANRI